MLHIHQPWIGIFMLSAVCVLIACLYVFSNRFDSRMYFLFSWTLILAFLFAVSFLSLRNYAYSPLIVSFISTAYLFLSDRKKMLKLFRKNH